MKNGFMVGRKEIIYHSQYLEYENIAQQGMPCCFRLNSQKVNRTLTLAIKNRFYFFLLVHEKIKPLREL